MNNQQVPAGVPAGMQLLCATYLQGQSESKDARACRALAERMTLRLQPRQLALFNEWRREQA